MKCHYFIIVLLLDEKKEKFMKQVKELEEEIEKYKSDSGMKKHITFSISNNFSLQKKY